MTQKRVEKSNIRKKILKSFFKYFVVMILGITIGFLSYSVYDLIQSEKPISTELLAGKNSNKEISNNDLHGISVLRKQALQNKMDKTAIGVLSIKDLNIKQNIYPIMTKYSLALGIAEYFSNQEIGKGNFILVGHNMGRKDYLFSNLLKAKVGSIIEIRSLGRLFQYKINKVKVIGQYMKYTSENEPSSDTLFYRHPKAPVITLFCCTNDSTHRFVVQGRLI